MTDSGLPICTRQAAKDEVLIREASMVKPKCPVGLGTQCSGPVGSSVQLGHYLHWATEDGDSSKAIDKPYIAALSCHKR